MTCSLLGREEEVMRMVWQDHMQVFGMSSSNRQLSVNLTFLKTGCGYERRVFFAHSSRRLDDLVVR